MNPKLLENIFGQCKSTIEEYNKFNVLNYPAMFSGGITFNIDPINSKMISIYGWCKLSDEWVHIFYAIKDDMCYVNGEVYNLL